MKLNKHIMAMNLAAVIAFGAVAGIIAPSVAGEDNIVAYAAVTDGQASVQDEVTGGQVSFNEKDNPDLKGCDFESNGDGATVTLTAVDKKAKKIKFKAGTLKVGDKEYKITSIKKGTFKGSKATSIDVSALELEKLTANMFQGAKNAKTIKVNGAKLTKKSIDKNFVKGLKKLTKIQVVAKAKQFNKIKKALNTAAKKTGNKKTQVKRVKK
ncbi:hypothetical protein [Butyrivibrio sp. INlla16]|uniref:hypothetical protein n=1 Tax=Butyrivibrio sp. INlla16 TaxID=1520807 RepID=UPI00088D273D|nr:hypothetical protein [Butyrivibrio sp. INlla16]SDB20123.1 hypothetical protein SAMN02910263_00982 [Butyrivibrio sp. INlla16]